MDFCDNSTIVQYFVVNQTQDSSAQDYQKSLYRYLCPVLIMGCFVSVVLNLLLVVIGNTKTINKSPILVLSLNLATTDCLASLFVGTGLVTNSYLPVVFNIHLGNGHCINLVVEIFRLSALIASAMHLLSLALVHYKGIVKPLHYRAVIFCSQHRTRSIHLMSFLCWIIPVIFFVVYFVTIPCQGFRSVNCNVHFVLTRRFRMVIVISFFIPLIMMLFLYLRIFTIIKSHQEQRNLAGSVRGFSKPGVTHTNSNASQRKESVSSQSSRAMVVSLKWCANCSRADTNATNGTNGTNGANGANGTSGTNGSPAIKNNGDVPVSRRSGNLSIRSVTTSSTKYCFKPQSQVQGHTKALMTTLLILGTYLVCYIPAVIFFAVTCVNGCPFPILHMSMKNRIMFSFITNGLVIVKAIVDPFIYTYRMKEMKIALNRYCLKRGNLRSSTMTSQRSGTLTTLRSTSPSSLKHRCAVAIAETSLQ